MFAVSPAVEKLKLTAALINAACTVTETISLKDTPVAARSNPQQKILSSGWNLISLPGVVPQPLTSFTDNTQFRLYSCNPVGTDCLEIPKDTILTPGKPYWLYTQNGLTITYGIR